MVFIFWSLCCLHPLIVMLFASIVMDLCCWLLWFFGISGLQTHFCRFAVSRIVVWSGTAVTQVSYWAAEDQRVTIYNIQALLALGEPSAFYWYVTCRHVLRIGRSTCLLDRNFPHMQIWLINNVYAKAEWSSRHALIERTQWTTSILLICNMLSYVVYWLIDLFAGLQFHWHANLTEWNNVNDTTEWFARGELLDGTQWATSILFICNMLSNVAY